MLETLHCEKLDDCMIPCWAGMLHEVTGCGKTARAVAASGEGCGKTADGGGDEVAASEALHSL